MEQGFSHVVLLDCDTIELRPEVRQMCASDTCHKYDKCWKCPDMDRISEKTYPRTEE